MFLSPPRYLENVIENCQSKTEWEREKKMRHQWPLPTYCLSASLICSWRETSTSLHSLTTAPSVDEDVPPPSDYTHTWELTNTNCSSVNWAADILSAYYPEAAATAYSCQTLRSEPHSPPNFAIWRRQKIFGVNAPSPSPKPWTTSLPKTIATITWAAPNTSFWCILC